MQSQDNSHCRREERREEGLAAGIDAIEHVTDVTTWLGSGD